MDPHAHRHPRTPHRREGHSQLPHGDGGRKGAAGANQDGSSEIDLDRPRQRHPGHVFPATACLVQERIGAKRLGALTCPRVLRFCLRVDGGAQFVGTGTHKKFGHRQRYHGLPSRYQDRATCVLFRRWRRPQCCWRRQAERGHHRFSDDVDGAGGTFLYMPGGGSLHPSSQETVEKRMHYVHQKGRSFQVMRCAMAEMATHLLAKNGFTKDDLKFAGSHQANLRIIRATQGAARGRRFKVGKYRPVWQYHGGDDSTGSARCVEQGRLPKATWF